MRISDWSSDVCSSDLARACRHLEPDDDRLDHLASAAAERLAEREQRGEQAARILRFGPGHVFEFGAMRRIAVHHRSEEHTSELQSLMRISYAVFCLKKKTYNSKPYKANQPHIHPLVPSTNIKETT